MKALGIVVQRKQQFDTKAVLKEAQGQCPAVYVVYESGWAEENYHGFVDEMFIVLDAPKVPMDPAWVSVLRISCRWARGESTNDGAAKKLTEELYMRGHYNGGELAYTSPGISGGQTFYLKSFLEDSKRPPATPSRFPWGQCDDFADFLVCLVTSVGAYPFKAQRTHTPPPGFWTNPITTAGQGLPGPGGATPRSWNYHQFAIHDDNVWDGCIAFNGTTIPVQVPRDTTYADSLVDFSNSPGFIWSPTPTGGFVPSVTTAPAP